MPAEYQGIVVIQPTSAPEAPLQQKLLFGNQVPRMMAKTSEMAQTLQGESSTSRSSGVALKPWDERHRDAAMIRRDLQTQLNGVAGQHIVVSCSRHCPDPSGCRSGLMTLMGFGGWVTCRPSVGKW